MNKASEAHKRWRPRSPEKYRARYERCNARGRGKDHNSGTRYTEAEVEEIMAQESDDVILAEKLGRTVVAMQMKRSIERAKRATGLVSRKSSGRPAVAPQKKSTKVVERAAIPPAPKKDEEGRVIIACEVLD